MAEDEGKRGRSGSRTTGDATATIAPGGQATTPTATDPHAAAAAAVPLAEDDSANRTKVPLAFVLSDGERLLGIPRRELVAAFEGDEREDLTLNAARKTVEDWRSKVQNPEEA